MTVTIPANDHGQIRIFSVPTPAPAGLEEKTPAALQSLFGTDALDTDFIDVVDTRQLAGLSLLDYLHQGYDIPADAADNQALRDVRGVLVLIMSRATGGVATTLTLAPGVTHITTTGDPARLRIPTNTPTASAKGTVPGGKPAPSQAAMSGRIATIALIVMFLLVVLMIWVAS